MLNVWNHKNDDWRDISKVKQNEKFFIIDAVDITRSAIR